MKNALISIVIPVYNSEKYLEKCIESIENQSYKNIEVILIDDGSTDNSKKISLALMDKYNNIQYFYQSNSGPSKARNLGINKSSGEYLMFVDSDDFLPEDAILNMISNIGNHDVILGGWVGIYENGKRDYYIPKLSCTLNGKNIQNLLEYIISNGIVHGNYGYLSSAFEGPVAKLYVTNILKKNNIYFPEDLKYSEDVCFNYIYFQFCENIKVISIPVYYANRHDDSLSNHPQLLMPKFNEIEEYFNKYNFKKINISQFIKYRKFLWIIHDLQQNLQNYHTFKRMAEIECKNLKFSKIERKEFRTIWNIEYYLLKHSKYFLYVFLKIKQKLKR